MINFDLIFVTGREFTRPIKGKLVHMPQYHATKAYCGTSILNGDELSAEVSICCQHPFVCKHGKEFQS
jgi:hypothetical protein